MVVSLGGDYNYAHALLHAISWWVWPQSAKSGAAMAATLKALPAPLDQEGILVMPG